MAAEPLVLTFDVGTQSTRAMLVNKKGEVLGKTQREYERAYHSPKPGWAEQDPFMYWNTICDLSRQLKEQAGALWNDVAAVTTTCIRATVICVDKEGAPLRDAIVWLDERRVQNLPPLPGKSRVAFKVAGLGDSISTIRSSMAGNWLVAHEPETWAKTDKFILLSSFLNHRFSGSMADSTSNLMGIMPYDTKTRAYLPPNDIRRCLYSVEDDKMVELVPPGEILGPITPEAAEQSGIPAGIPYVVTGADKACETLGLSCIDTDSAALSFGTTATVEVCTPNYFSPFSIMPPYASLNGCFLPEVETFRGYWLISWFKKEFAAKEVEEAAAKGCSAEDLLNKRLQEIPPGCDGLIFQPTFTPGPDTPHAKGSIIGLSDVHTRIHIYRAIIEGINFSLMEGLRIIEKKGKFRVKKLYVAGGGSRSDEICQITANMFGLPVYRTQTHEVCGVGSSMVAFISLGEYKDYGDAIKGMVHVKDEFLPDKQEHKTYRKLYSQVYTKIFDNLSPLYEKINGIISAEHGSTSV